MSALYEDPAFLAFTGGFLHPGGKALTQAAFAGLPPCRVLDVGCGAGASVALLRGLGYEAYGVEASPALVAAAQSPYVKRGDAYCLTGRYSALLYECVLSLLSDKPAALSAAKGALEPGGRLLVHDLYIRAGSGPGPLGVPCARGALTKEALFAAMGAAGFACQSFCERSGALQSFLGAFIMAFGSAAPFYEAALGGCGGAPGVKLGYFTSVWEAQDARG